MFRVYQWLSSWFNYYVQQDECFELKKCYIIPEEETADMFEYIEDNQEECVKEIWNPYFNLYKK